jgi:hypothetical protein
MKSKVLVVLLVLAPSCSDPRKPSEKNFRVAIQAYLDASYPKCILMGSFPVDTPELDLSNMSPALEALKDAGVLTSREKSRRTAGGFFGEKKKTQVLSTYDLTSEGRKSYDPNAGKGRGGICIGKARVIDIARFTEPADFLGSRISSVTYTFAVENLPPWAHNAAVAKAFHQVEQWNNSPLQASDVVVLTNKGWVHQKMTRMTRSGG